jgi:hypothetical protein
MSCHDFKRLLKFIRKAEKEMRFETFILIFGCKGQSLWDEYRNFDYSLSLLMDCMDIPDQDKLCNYLFNQFKAE